ncbi:N-acetyltransferase [Microcystis aeruginosa LEGE 11464]|jgi:phosphinothricin acetyltransferase|uniref:GNAT family N-acetyltransferase n=1 Tax=Microcystis TaxID=1125 RepID=UPI00188184AA|nr:MULTISPECIES: GNAT family N-acetyltransferase [Microcystis]MBE9088701.1 N-acetyltransferase [Microcystis aeruginosa LEGE 11464]MCA2659432.1 N-acetyltransferase [Microcystis sp. M049S2]MCZ8125447.1 GNAT family N-acetyltransferase [Microcystis sp. LE19-114.1B]
MIIREAKETDLPTIIEIYNAAVPTRKATADLKPISLESRREWFKNHDPEQYPIWVIALEGRVVGWLSLQMFYGRVAYQKTAEVSLYISPDYQGRGIGKLLVEYALNCCPKLGISNLICIIFAHNQASIRLFEKFGFQRWGYLPQIAELDDFLADVVILGKKVA